jgi:hypothetical protein
MTPYGELEVTIYKASLKAIRRNTVVKTFGQAGFMDYEDSSKVCC